MADNKVSDEEEPDAGGGLQEDSQPNSASAGEFSKDYSARTLSVVSLVLISSLLLFGTVVGYLLNNSRVDAQLETQLASERLWANQVLRTTIGSAYDSSMLDDVCRSIAPEGQQGRDLSSVIFITKKLRCELMPGIMPGMTPGNTPGNTPGRQSLIKIYFISTTAGYSGEIDLIVGLDQGNVLSYLRVLNHRETTGFGEKLLHSNSTWMKSLLNKEKEFFTKPRTNDELDAISGATITANAVREMVNQSFLMEQATSEPHE